MKTLKKSFGILVAIGIIVMLVFISCSKSETKGVVTQNKNDSEKGPLFTYTFTFKSGHEGSQCGYSCFCIVSPPTYHCFHMPCWAFGDDCSHTITISIELKKSQPSKGIYYEASMELEEQYSRDSLLLPARSIPPDSLENCEYWLNWPGQYALRIADVPGDIFAVDSVFFTDEQYYDNN